VRRDARGRGALSTTRSDMRRVWVVIGRRVGTHAGLGVGVHTPIAHARLAALAALARHSSSWRRASFDRVSSRCISRSSASSYSCAHRRGFARDVRACVRARARGVGDRMAMMTTMLAPTMAPVGWRRRSMHASTSSTSVVAMRRKGMAMKTRAAAGDAGADDDDGFQQKKWKPKPLPSTFGDAELPKKTKSPFDGPGAGAGGGGAAAPAKAASPFAAAPAKAASPFAAPAAKKASPSPFGAAEARSPFEPAPGAAKSPFGGSSVKNPFNEPDAALYGAAPVKPREREAKKVEEEKSIWESLPKPSLGQVVIVLSFTTIISLMLGTFWVVVNAGGVHFNDAPAI